MTSLEPSPSVASNPLALASLSLPQSPSPSARGGEVGGGGEEGERGEGGGEGGGGGVVTLKAFIEATNDAIKLDVPSDASVDCTFLFLIIMS